MGFDGGQTSCNDDCTVNDSLCTTCGDAAVEGLLNGILAGIAMAVWTVAVEWLNGIAPQTALGYFDPGENASPLTGTILHLAVSGVYGLVFGILSALLLRIKGVQPKKWWGPALGALYGLLIFGMAASIILPQTASELGALPMWSLVVAHLLYGIVLGTLQLRGRA